VNISAEDNFLFGSEVYFVNMSHGWHQMKMT
jgi:hypothetical protein